MIKTLNFILFFLAICVLAAGWILKSNVSKQQEYLTSLEKQIVAQTENLHVLQAEWAYRAKPEAIKTLSGDALEPLQASQLQTMPQFGNDN